MDSKKLFCFILMILAGSIILTSIPVMLNRFTSKKAAWSVMELWLARQGLTATQRKAMKSVIFVAALASRYPANEDVPGSCCLLVLA